MTFDLDPGVVEARTNARRLAEALGPEATRTGLTADLAARAAAAVPAPAETLAWLVCLEELALCSGALAVGAAATSLGGVVQQDGLAFGGLRGATGDAVRATLERTPRGSLAVAVTLIGLGRRIVDHVIVTLRSERERGGRPEQTQWTMSDAATALEAARLVAWRAAQALSVPGDGGAPVSVGTARLLAGQAARQAVEAGRRALPLDAFAEGTAIDWAVRDIDTAVVAFGSEAGVEAAVAPAVGPS